METTERPTDGMTAERSLGLFLVLNGQGANLSLTLSLWNGHEVALITVSNKRKVEHHDESTTRQSDTPSKG